MSSVKKLEFCMRALAVLIAMMWVLVITVDGQVPIQPQDEPQYQQQDEPQFSEQGMQDVSQTVAVTRSLQLYDVEQEMLYRLNYVRILNGREPLYVDQVMMNSAREHARWMAKTGNMVHGNLSGVSGENIAMGQDDPQEVTKTWVNSSGHFRNMVSTGYKFVGVGVFERNGTKYWCQQFK